MCPCFLRSLVIGIFEWLVVQLVVKCFSGWQFCVVEFLPGRHVGVRIHALGKYEIVVTEISRRIYKVFPRTF